MMIYLCLLLAVAVLTMTRFPDTPVGRTLHRWLVARPAEALSRFGAGRTIALALLGFAGMLLFWIGEAEGLRLFALGAPEAFTWLAMFDAGAVIDLIAVAIIAQGATRLAPLRERLRRMLNVMVTSPVRRAGRAVRSAIHRRPTEGDDDAEPRPAFRLQPAFG